MYARWCQSIERNYVLEKELIYCSQVPPQECKTDQTMAKIWEQAVVAAAADVVMPTNLNVNCKRSMQCLMWCYYTI